MMALAKNTTLPFLTFLLLTSTLAGQPQDVKSLTKLEYGDNSVGFKFLKLSDPTRCGFLEQKDPGNRIMPIYLWYPGQSNSSSTEASDMALKNYMQYWGLETNYDIPNDSTYFYAQRNYERSFFWLSDLSNFDKLFNATLSTRAVEGIQIQNKKFPLVLLNHGPIINWQFIAEYLASHGFIVAYAPVAGTYDKRLEADITGIETQLRDMEFIIGQLSDIPEVDLENIGIIGHSLGSLAAVGLAAKNKSVKAVISLDGVVGDPNEGDLLYEMPYFTNHKFTAPLLHINAGADFTSDMTKIDKLQFSDRYVLELEGMRHSDFTGQGHFDKLGIEMSGPAQGNYTLGFQLSNTYSLSFLNSLLKNQSLHNFNDLFQQTDNDSLIIKKITKPKEVKGYAYADLIKLVFDQDFDRLFDVYEQHKHLEIEAFSYSTFLDVGMMLYFRAHYKESLKWFQLFGKSYPNAVRAQYQMANSLRRLGDNSAAIPVLETAQNLLGTDEFLTEGQKVLYANRIKRILKRLEEN